MRKLLTLALGAALLLSLAVPASYLLVSRDLPPLATRDEILHTLEVYVGGQRQKVFAGVSSKLVEPFEILGAGDLSPALVAGALAVQGCPDYFGFAREEGTDWLARVVTFGMGGGFGGAGPGRCELIFADRLGVVLGLPGQVHRAVAAQQMHDALAKHELLDLELSVRYFAPGILGVRSASQRLMGKDPRVLSVAEAAELLLAEVDYDEVWRCRNPTLLKIKRNNVVEQMAAFKLIKRADAEHAKAEKLRCLARPG